MHPSSQPRHGRALALCLILGAGSIAQRLDAQDAEETFVRGNANSDMRLDIADPIAILTYIFLGSTRLSCLDAADINDDGVIDISDPIYNLNYLYGGGAQPRAPFPLPGTDPTPDPLDCLEGSSSSDGQIDARIEPSRTRGVAPLYVFFDATGTIANSTTNPYHDLDYAWNFDDPRSGVWSTNGKSRNLARGPVSAHVFDQPGIYQVQLTVRDIFGALSASSVEIHVEDPAVVFPGERTVCFSTEGDFTGAPEGSLRVTTTDFLEVMSHIAPRKRLLLRRGESWTTSREHRVRIPGPGHIGAFGTGERPRINYRGSGTLFPLSGHTESIFDWRISDLDLDGGDVSGNRAFFGRAWLNQVLLLRIRIRRFDQGYYLTFPADPEENADNALVECHIEDPNLAEREYSGRIAGHRIAMLGCDMPTSGLAVVRVGYFNGFVISHCRFGGAVDSQHILKLHARPFENLADIARNLVASDNHFTGGLERWMVTVGPEDHHTDQRVEDVIFERNFWRASSSTYRALMLSMNRATVRNSIFDFSAVEGTAGRDCVAIHGRGIEPPPTDIRVFNITGYAASGGNHEFRTVFVSRSARRAVAQNNLVWSDSRDIVLPLWDEGAGTLGTANYNASSFPATTVFTDPFSGRPEGFRLSPEAPSQLIDRGAATSVFVDYFDSPRPRGAGLDLGAVER